MTKPKEKDRAGISVFFFRHNGGDFVLTEFNDEALKLTNGDVRNYAGMSVSELASNFPEIRRNMMECFRSRKAVKSTQMYRLKSTGEEAFFTSAYVYIPPDRVLVITEQVMKMEIGAAEGEGEATRLHEAIKLAREKDIALRQVLNHMDKQFEQHKAGLQKHIDFVVLPLMHRLEQKLTGDLRAEMEAVKAAVLGTVPASPDHVRLRATSLTPREIQVCELIRTGYQSKEIASILNIAVRTVNKTRQNIRDKLAIRGSKTSLKDALAPIIDTE